jgi:hypothetical protein
VSTVSQHPPLSQSSPGKQLPATSIRLCETFCEQQLRKGSRAFTETAALFPAVGCGMQCVTVATLTRYRHEAPCNPWLPLHSHKVIAIPGFPCTGIRSLQPDIRSLQSLASLAQLQTMALIVGFPCTDKHERPLRQLQRRLAVPALQKLGRRAPTLLVPTVLELHQPGEEAATSKRCANMNSILTVQCDR